ncbi:uncharacterized protein LOC110537462 isoform X2 [Oncorhynchus mykiss]|uniref:uncharacterized protein LOC110537462 isoform X2 n=1 Tax=Oncorhynchus mykiss TaxID=8022 RepID=UPI0018777273|nr:uncharacterized protein LOC110537462 isoform X2 [Oncorhynchus mykiss]
MVHEMMKENRDLPLINQHMQKTFALRHQEIVQSSPTVEHLRTRWPALFLEAQVHAEFQRITNQSLQQTFYSALDHHTPRLLTLFREEEGKSTTHEGKFSSILRVYNEQWENSATLVYWMELPFSQWWASTMRWWVVYPSDRPMYPLSLRIRSS